MQKLLIVECSEEYLSILSDRLSGDFQLETCLDGDTALQLLQIFQPDILILNMSLPFKDGLTVLQESPYQPPLILAVSAFNNPYLERRAQALGVAHILIAPSPLTVCKQLVALIQAAANQPEDPQAQVVRHLHILNFTAHRDGYYHLCAGIPLFKADPYMSLSKDLYPAVSQGKSMVSVERAIRRSIDTAWSRRDPVVWARYFPGITQCPSNKEFISRLAELLK